MFWRLVKPTEQEAIGFVLYCQLYCIVEISFGFKDCRPYITKAVITRNKILKFSFVINPYLSTSLVTFHFKVFSNRCNSLFGAFWNNSKFNKWKSDSSVGIRIAITKIILCRLCSLSPFIEHNHSESHVRRRTSSHTMSCRI